MLLGKKCGNFDTFFANSIGKVIKIRIFDLERSPPKRKASGSNPLRGARKKYRSGGASFLLERFEYLQFVCYDYAVGL